MSDSSPSSDFIRLLTDHQTTLRGLIISMIPGSQDVNDILQDANVVLWEKKQSFQQGTNFKAWACNVTRKMVMQYWDKQKKQNKISLSAELASSVADLYVSVENSVTLNDRLHVLRQCIERLSKNEQQLILDRYTVQETMDTYAKQRGLSYGAMRVALYRIKQRLRSCMESNSTVKGDPA